MNRGSHLAVARSRGPGPCAPRWLPAGKSAAVCFSIDDLHPGTSQDAYEAGGDLAAGAMGRVLRLQEAHRDLKVTLAVTPDWRLDSLVPDAWRRHIPWADRHVHWTRLHPAGHFRLDRHPSFVSFLNGLERCEVVPHGLHHANKGPRLAVEFENQSEERCLAMVRQALSIFEAAGLRFVRGFIPPAWTAPPSLIAALARMDIGFISSARDLQTPVSPEARTSMSGLSGVSLIYPEVVGDRGLVHLSCNFQATSSFERAVRILDLGGVLHVKAHIFKSDGKHVMADGLDDLYCNYLDLLFTFLAGRYGDRLWWAHLSEVAARTRGEP